MTKNRTVKSKLKDIEIDSKNPFLNDALQNRAEYAKLLTSVLNLYGTEGCVLSINGKWGSGKSTFIKMWRQQLDNDGYRTIYFNAWEYDYTDNPLVAIISELKSISQDNETFKKLAACVGRISLNIIIALAKGAIKQILKIDTDEVINAGAQAIQDFGQKQIDEFENQKQTLVEFKGLLREYVANGVATKVPLVFFIDELDRCNPTYAVKTLEIIKHLFDVPNIVFVLGINKEQLSYAIQGYYGSSKMNSMEYLKRFIDIELNLPEGNLDNYCKLLYNYYRFDDFFNNNYRSKGEREKEEFISTASMLCSHNHISLRTISKIFAQCRLSLEDFTKSAYLETRIFFFLCMLKISNPNLYHGILSHKYDYQGLVNAILEEMPERVISKREDDINDYTHEACFVNSLIGGLLFLYVNYEGEPKGIVPWKKVQKENNNTSYELTINCGNADVKGINNVISWYIERKSPYYVGLQPILERIELLKYMDFNK